MDSFREMRVGVRRGSSGLVEREKVKEKWDLGGEGFERVLSCRL